MQAADTAPQRTPAAGGAAADEPVQIALAPHESLLRAALRRFRRHRLAMVGTVIVGVLTILAVFGPIFLPDPYFTDITTGKPPAPPSVYHFLGTDTSGRDVMARVVLGLRTSLIVGFGAVAVYIVIGTLIGLLAGYFGKGVDQVLMRATDTILSIPTLLLVIIFVSVVGPSLLSVIAVIGLLGWPAVARIVRGQLLSLREAEFITAVRVIGVGNRAIITRHLLPNLIGPLTVIATFGIASAILLEASLSFLGLGVQAPEPSLGNMIIEARAPAVLKAAPWFWLPPGILIALLVLGVNFIGDGLRDALDPRSQRRS